MGVARPVVEPVGEGKSNFDFFQALALACGFDDAMFHETCMERLKRYLATMEGIPQDICVEEIIEGRLVHSTKSCPSGKVLEDAGLKFHFSERCTGPEPATACLTPAGEFIDPDLLARFPLQLITPPHHDLLNSTFGEKYQDDCGSVIINPADAARFNVKDGAMVIIANNRGRSTRRAIVSENTQKGLLVAEGLFWIPQEDSSGVAAGGINDLTSQKLTDMGGGATFHECMVTLIAQ
jgi:anaerobic selenocysteine-containing dehydrogenase